MVYAAAVEVGCATGKCGRLRNADSTCVCGECDYVFLFSCYGCCYLAAIVTLRQNTGAYAKGSDTPLVANVVVKGDAR